MQHTSDKSVCVIGAGSSGITAVKTLRDRGIPCVCFEKGSGIGGNWRYRNDNGQSAAYASLHINTSKTRMAYADYPMPDDYPDYPHHSQILDYFEDYVDHFGIRDAIRFKTGVEEVRPTGDGDWEVTTEDREGGRTTERYRAVLVANGHHWDPKWPDFPGRFDGPTLHAHAYETPKDFEDRRVLVVGIGNSGVDIACETCRVARRTFLSTRRSAHVLPKYVFGRPVDHLATPASSHLPLAFQKLFYKVLLNVTRGPQEGFGVREPEHDILAAHPTISAELLNLVGHGRIKMMPDVAELRGGSVRFADGSEEEIDVIVYATGYKISFPFFKEDLMKTADNRVRLFRHVVHPDYPGLYFIGLIQPLGAVMPLAEAQSRWVAKLLAGECGLPPAEVMEREIERDLEAMARRYVASPRHTIQVDFYPYLRAVRREMRRGRPKDARAKRRAGVVPRPA